MKLAEVSVKRPVFAVMMTARSPTAGVAVICLAVVPVAVLKRFP